MSQHTQPLPQAARRIDFEAHLVSRVEPSAGLLRLQFRTQEPCDLALSAGQHVSLTLGSHTTGAAAREYCFSVASSAKRLPELCLVVRASDPSAPAEFFRHLQPGARVRFAGPRGGFVLEPYHDGDVVFGVTGTGGSAIVPMLEELAERREPGRRRVIWGLRSERELSAFGDVRELCERAGAELQLCLSRPDPGWRGRRGRIDEPLLASLRELREPVLYLVGHPEMVRNLRRALIDRGVDPKSQIRNELHLGR